MKTVAIIAEYNPFHTGHEYQIKEIRREFGADTRIIAVMSGNYTQRGELAVMDKSERAKAATLCGVNLVLELPFPYSMSSAEFFASSAVKIIDSLNVVDHLSFGSESGDVFMLSEIAENISSDEYKSALKLALASSEDKGVGYPKLSEEIYRSLYGKDIPRDVFSPNNILAIEYIKAIKRSKSNIIPHTVKRSGAAYSEKNITDDQHQSASAIRELFNKDISSALKYIPNNAKNIVLDAYNNKSFPCDDNRLSSAVISYFRLNPKSAAAIHDAGDGLYNRLQKYSFDANDITTLINLTDTKKYTRSRIRRAIWYSFFGVTSSEVKELPCYTTVLAMDDVGKAILKEIKKKTDLAVITKPSSTDGLSDTARRQKALSDKADSVFQLTKPAPPSGAYALRTTPYIVK
jgi:predicted nucleotidyltransferase